MTFKVPEFNFKFKEGFEAHDYQQEVFHACINHIRESNDPAIVYASVSAGKSLMMAMLGKHFQNVGDAAQAAGFTSNHSVMILARQGELIRQNSQEAWGIQLRNSIYSASLVKPKSTANLYPIIYGTEGTIYNEIDKAFANHRVTLLMIDEAHMLNFDDPNSQYMQIISKLRERNPNLKIIGFTGSPWRGTETIIGDFWKKQLCDISRQYLTDRGFVMPTVFGFGDVHYEIDGDFDPDYQSSSDMTASQLKQMENQILEEKTVTQEIMTEVQKVMQRRNLALITCAGHKHCKEAAKYLPANEYAIITEKTSVKERTKIQDRCNAGEIKYVLQIGCWSVGVSINCLDTIVILRRIGSLTLYEQLVGRGVRMIRQPELDRGVIKNECLVLDYTDTTERMAALYNSDELDSAEKKRAEDNNEDMIECPECAEMNSMKARRCCGRDTNNNRCEYFFVSKQCDHCQTHNDTTARTCRNCGEWMIDPNEKLLRTHYTDADYKEVLGWNVQLSNDQQKIVVSYMLENKERAQELFMFDRSKMWMKAAWRKFVNEHIQDKSLRRSIIGAPNAIAASAHIDRFAKPDFITHRVNDKGWSVINRKVMPWDESPFKEVI